MNGTSSSQALPSDSNGAVGLVYVMILLIVLVGGAIAVWLLYIHANPPSTPSPAPTPPPHSDPGTWKMNAGMQPYTSWSAVQCPDAVHFNFPPASDAPSCFSACTDGDVYAIYGDPPSYNNNTSDIFPSPSPSARSYVLWDSDNQNPEKKPKVNCQCVTFSTASELVPNCREDLGITCANAIDSGGTYSPPASVMWTYYDDRFGCKSLQSNIKEYSDIKRPRL